MAVRRPTRARIALRRATLLAVLSALTFGALATAAYAETSGSAENEFAVVTATCKTVTIEYRNFPNALSNKVTQLLVIHGTKISEKKVIFNGPTHTETIEIAVPPGPGNVDIHATWKTNGSSGNFDLGVPLECPPEPSFSIAKLQRIGNGSFTTEPVSGKIGQVVEYEIVVKNTGNLPLTFSNFLDEHCEEIAGGPGANPVKLREATTYTCKHTLTSVGVWENTATVTGTAANQPPVTHTSNTVVATVPPEPAFTVEKLQEIEGSETGFTKNSLTFKVGQTVLYEIVVKNTGNVPLTFEFTDVRCESLTGGPAGPVEPGAETTYFCKHLLTEEKPYVNTATITGDPPAGDGSPFSHESNVVEVVPHAREEGCTENEHAKVCATCQYVTVTYTGFPNQPNNTLLQILTIHGTIVSKVKITFNGPTTTVTIPIVVPPGPGPVDIHAQWKTNGASGFFDLGVALECPAEPALTVTKLQEVQGSGSGFTASPVSGEPGQRVNYEIIVKNTGNMVLTLSNFIDEHCESITGGTTKLALRKQTTYLCSRVLGAVGEEIENIASITAKGAAKEPPMTVFSNTVRATST